MGGTNAHAVLEEAPTRPQSAAGGHWCLPLSARSESALLAQARELADWLAQDGCEVKVLEHAVLAGLALWAATGHVESPDDRG